MVCKLYKEGSKLHAFVSQSINHKVCDVNESLHTVGDTLLWLGIHRWTHLARHTFLPAKISKGVHVWLELGLLRLHLKEPLHLWVNIALSHRHAVDKKKVAELILRFYRGHAVLCTDSKHVLVVWFNWNGCRCMCVGLLVSSLSSSMKLCLRSATNLARQWRVGRNEYSDCYAVARSSTSSEGAGHDGVAMKCKTNRGKVQDKTVLRKLVKEFSASSTVRNLAKDYLLTGMACMLWIHKAI